MSHFLSPSRALSFASLLLVLGLASGCGNSTSPESSGNNTKLGIWTVPNTGSMFVYSNGWYGTNDTVVIRSIGQTVNGKSNVMTFDTLHSPYNDVGFLAYEPNNDISIGDSSLGWAYWQNGWLYYPAGAHTTDTIVLKDTMIRTVDGLQRNLNFQSRAYLGQESLTVNGQSIQTIHVRQMWKSLAMGPTPAWDRNSWSMNDLWLAPSLGFIVKSHVEYAYNDEITTSYDKMLLSYTLR